MRPSGNTAVYQWLQNSSVGDTLRSSPILLSGTETVHLLGLVLFVGTVLAVDLNLLGVGMRRQPASRIARELRHLTWIGLVATLITGPLLLAADAEKLSVNPIFPMKMVMVVVAVVFQVAVYKRITMAGYTPKPLTAKVVGALSLILWFGIGYAAKLMDIF
jgi:hypothetical protein